MPNVGPVHEQRQGLDGLGWSSSSILAARPSMDPNESSYLLTYPPMIQITNTPCDRLRDADERGKAGTVHSSISTEGTYVGCMYSAGDKSC